MHIQTGIKHMYICDLIVCIGAFSIKILCPRALTHSQSLSSSSSSSDALSSSFSVVNGMRNNNNVFLFYCVCISRCLFHCHCCNIIVITVSLSPSFASPPSHMHSLLFKLVSACFILWVLF